MLKTPPKALKLLKNRMAENENALHSHKVNQFKQTLQWIMEEKKINEIELSRLTNLSPATIHRLIHGITDPRLSTLRAIADYFKIRIEQLIGDYPISTISKVLQNESNTILFSNPILIPLIELDKIDQYVFKLEELNTNNWAHWYSANFETNEKAQEFFATKLTYTAGNLLPAESILIVKRIQNVKEIKISEGVIGKIQDGNMFVGQIAGNSHEIIVYGNCSIKSERVNIFAKIEKCELPLKKISCYTSII